MRAAVVINPIAGAGLAGSLEHASSLAVRVLNAAGYADVSVAATEGPDDAYRLAREARDRGAALVVAWGGDGTVNGVASALVRTPIPLGIVPAGSGNGLARDLGLPLDAQHALEVASRGRERSIDAGEIGGSLFFNVAGVGLDAAIAERLAAPGARRGLPGYVLATFAEWPRYRPRAYALEHPGNRWSGRALLIAFANSRQYGSGAQIAPRALLDDGCIDVVTVEAQPFVRLAGRLPAFFRGTLREGRGLHMWRCATLRLQSDGRIPFHVDGEPRTGTDQLDLSTHAGVLRVRVES